MLFTVTTTTKDAALRDSTTVSKLLEHQIMMYTHQDKTAMDGIHHHPCNDALGTKEGAIVLVT